MTDGPYIEHAVLVDPVVAWLLNIADVQADLRGRAVESAMFDEQETVHVLDVLEAIERAAEVHRRRIRGSARGTAEQVFDGDMAPSDLMTTTQAAEETGVSASYIRRLARDERLLSARKVGGVWQVDPAEVAEVREDNPRSATGEGH